MTTAPPVTPPVPAPPIPGPEIPADRRVSTRTGLRLGAAGVVALILVVGVVATWGAADRQSAMTHAATRAQPLGLAAEDLYRDLSDADAAAAEVFLSGSQADAAGRQRFDDDLRRVSDGLAAVNADAGGSATLRDAAGELLADLPVYTGLVGTALADSRQNLPVGAAYLREASGLLRAKLLPAAKSALQVETDRLAADDAVGASGPIPEAVVIGLALAVLVGFQIFLARRTNRQYNGGLARATVLVLGLGIWAGISMSAQADAVTKARQHRQAVGTLLATELAAVEAHGDELLGLAARGEDVGGYEHDFTAVSAELTRLLALGHGPRLADARAGYAGWLAAHKKLVPLETDPQGDNSGNVKALKLVSRADPTGPGAAFVRVDADLRQALAEEEAGFVAAIHDGRGDIGVLPYGAAVLAAGALVSGAFGVNRRLKEYR